MAEKFIDIIGKDKDNCSSATPTNLPNAPHTSAQFSFRVVLYSIL